MKRLSVTLLAGIALALTLAACGGSSAGSTAAQDPGASGPAAGKAPDGLIKPETLRVCVDPEYAPMEYLENGTSGEPIGFDPDAARAVGELWGVETEFEITAFEGLMPALQAKRCDVMWSGLYLNEERTAVADGVAYLATGPQLVVRAGDEDKYATTDALAGQTVAVQAGGANEQALQDLSDQLVAAGKPALKIQSYPKTAETVAAVTNGKAEALLETDVGVAAIVEQSNGKLAPVEDLFAADTRFAAYVSKGGPLTAPLREAVKTLHDNGTLKQLADEYGLDADKLQVD